MKLSGQADESQPQNDLWQHCLLRPRRERPRGRAAEKRELLTAADDSITSSARIRNV